MSLINPLSFIGKARELGVAIAAFNIHNLETVQAVAEIAAEERAPVIFQATPGTLKHAGIPYLAAIVRAAADQHGIPMALHVDHCPSFATIVQCIRHGFTSVMVDGSALPYAENVALVRKAVEIAHYAGVAVEGELGRIGGAEDELSTGDWEASLTVPAEAAAFVAETGVDTLAVAIGTAHGVYKGEPRLDFGRLSAIKGLVDVPLVLHGASGVPENSIREAVARGICKFNIATELKIPMASALQEFFRAHPDETDPRRYMGAAKEAVKEVVRAKIRLAGADGLADRL